MTILKNKGQAAMGTIIITSLLTSCVGWLATNLLSSPSAAAASINVVNTKVEKLCQAYGDTVSRIDENMQSLGNALKVNVIKGRANSNPCKD